MEVHETLSQFHAIPDEIDEADLEADADAELDALGMEDEEEC